MNKIKKILAVSPLLSILFVKFDNAYAQSVGTTPTTSHSDLGYWVKLIFNWVTIVAGLIFVVLFLVGGIQYLTSAGNEEQAGKAKKLLVDAVIGLVIVLISYAAGTWVLRQLGITGVPGVN